MGVEFDGDGVKSGHLNYTLRPSAVPRSEEFEDIKGRKGWITNILFPQRAKQKKGKLVSQLQYLLTSFFRKMLS